MSTSELIMQQQLNTTDFGGNTANHGESYVAELQSIDGDDQEIKQFLDALSLVLEDVVAKFYVTQGTIYCVNENNQIGFYLLGNNVVGNERIKKIERFDTDGIPKECFKDAIKMSHYLAKASKHLVEYEGLSGYKLKVNLGGLKGGGNMMAPTQGYKWPVKGVGENARIVIPYSLKASKQNVELLSILYNKSKTSKSRTQLISKINSGSDIKLKSETATLESIETSIAKWNETRVVELISFAEYKQKYGSAPTRWIGFLTHNENAICQAPCIGMCPEEGEHIITCDIEGRFHSNPVRSIMHEIGHVIGLRHEHARTHRDDYIETNLLEEQDGIAFGNYDFYSIMHYELGNYPNQQYLYLSESVLLQRSNKNINKLLRNVGKMPVISPGDIQTIRKLYEAEFKAKVNEKSDDELVKQLSALRMSASKTAKNSAATAAPATTAAFPAAATATAPYSPANAACHCSRDRKASKEKAETFMPSMKYYKQSTPVSSPPTSLRHHVKSQEPPSTIYRQYTPTSAKMHGAYKQTARAPSKKTPSNY